MKLEIKKLMRIIVIFALSLMAIMANAQVRTVSIDSTGYLVGTGVNLFSANSNRLFSVIGYTNIYSAINSRLAATNGIAYNLAGTFTALIGSSLTADEATIDDIDAIRVRVPNTTGMFGETDDHVAPLKYVRRLQVTVVDDLAAQKAIESVDLGRLSFRNDTGQIYIYCPDMIIASDDINYIRPDDVPNDGVAGRWQLYNPKRTGTATLVSGTVTVADTSVTANTRIFRDRFTDGGTVGDSYSVSRSAGVSFTITSKTDGATQTLDTSVVAYQLIEP